MNPEVNAQAWLEAYAHTYLWVDDDWIDVGEQTFTYWQARLAQTTTIDVLADGRAKWRVRTRIVNDVGATETAALMCFALNSYAAGWSFVYDDESRSVDAIIAMCIPLDFDAWQLRLSETAKLSAWMSDVIAQRLAEAVSGSPAFTHPDHQPAVRDSFDGTYYYLETLRGRPERVLNMTQRLYPSVPQVARAFAEVIGADADSVKVDDDRILISVEGTGADLHASFAAHPIFGECWYTAVRFPAALSDNTAALASTMAWSLFADDDSTLLGGWASYDGDLVFAQWSTTSELRNQESLPSNRGRSSEEMHGVGDLWGLTSAVNGAIHLTLEAISSDGQGHEQFDAGGRLAAAVIGAISDVARPVLDVIPTEREEPAERRLLWMERKYVLAAAAWFNPIGPSVSTLEVCSLGDEDYLLYFLRHPLSPDFRVLSPLGSDDDLVAAAGNGVDLFQGGSLPHTLLLFDAPHAISAMLPELFRERIIETCRQSGIDLMAKASQLADAAGNPWALAAHHETPDPSSVPLPEPATSQDVPAAAYDEWFGQVSNQGSAGAIFAQLPDAWDGALNFQLSAGSIRWFDVGPLPIRYSSIGTVEK